MLATTAETALASASVWDTEFHERQIATVEALDELRIRPKLVQRSERRKALAALDHAGDMEVKCLGTAPYGLVEGVPAGDAAREVRKGNPERASLFVDEGVNVGHRDHP